MPPDVDTVGHFSFEGGSAADALQALSREIHRQNHGMQKAAAETQKLQDALADLIAGQITGSVTLSAPEPPEEPERGRAEPGMFVAPVWGFRAWRVQDNLLVSPYQDTVWPVGEELMSNHGGGSNRRSSFRSGRAKLCVPGQPCRNCGIYAFDDFGKLRRYQDQPHRNRPLDEVRGICAGWGQVTVCTDGWRAGRVYPLALMDWESSPALIQDMGYSNAIRDHYRMHRVANRYGIPVLETEQEMIEFAIAQGCVDPREMRP